MVISHVDEDLRIPLHGVVEDAEWSGLEILVGTGGCGVGGHDVGWRECYEQSLEQEMVGLFIAAAGGRF